MTSFEGVVDLGEVEVPVVVALEDRGISLFSGDTSIGAWADGEYTIETAEDGVYTITAENETLRFTPSRSDLFAAGIFGTEAVSFDDDTAPPRPLTRALFIILSAATAVLGALAAVRLISG